MDLAWPTTLDEALLLSEHGAAKSYGPFSSDIVVKQKDIPPVMSFWEQ